jgi:heat shock protein HtpX
MSGLKTAVLLGALSGLFLVVGGLLGGESGLIMAFGMAVIMNIGSYWFSDKIVLRMYKAQEVGAGHRLFDMTARLARRADLPMPKVYVIPDMSPNAFATGRNPQHAAVAATEGVLRLLSDSELEGVMAHELAHIKNRDILISSVAATIGAAITMLVHMGMFFGGGRDREDSPNPIVMIATMLLAPLAAMMIQMAVSRSREFGADRIGAQIAGSPMGLAQALRRLEAGTKQIPMHANEATAHMFIVNPLTAGGFRSLFSTHPPTQARVDALMRLQFGA